MEQTIIKAQAPRTTLMKLLDGLSEKQVVYMHAPAGFGKTVSSLLWLEHRESVSDIKRAWLSLDEYDNKMSEFCRRFISALSGFLPEKSPLRALVSNPGLSAAPVEFILRALNCFTDTGAGKNSYILVIDDLHIIKNAEILGLLPSLFKRLPENCTVLLLSRNAPPDSFSEMVAKGEFAVVDAEYLQFTSGEIKLFFSKNGRFISSRQADEILASTGGWAIGIRALLLADEKSYNIDLTGRYLENFLRTHVWERWNNKIKKFMTLVSVVKELTPEICERLTSGEKLFRKTGGEDILEGLARENAFLRKSGDNSYMFHDLFRDFLLNILLEEGEQALEAQYGKAGDYYSGKKDYFRAVEYYFRAKNGKGVAESLYNMYDYNSVYASIEDTLYAIHMSVSDSLVEKYPYLLETRIWAAYVEGRADELENCLDKYYRLFPKIVLQNPRSAIVLILIRFLDYRNNFIDSLKSVKLVPFKERVMAYTPSITQNMPLFHRSVRDFASDFDFDDDRTMNLLEKTIGVIVGNEYAVIKECLYAGLHYEKGNISEARESALAACANIPGDCSPEIKFCAMTILASSLFADGQKSEANRILDNIGAMIERDKAFYLKANLRAYTRRLQLNNGDKDAAEEQIRDYKTNVFDNPAFFKLYQSFTTARAYIVSGDYNMSALLLQKLLELSERYRRPLDIIEARILLAVSYWKKGGGRQNTALDCLEQAAVEAYKYRYTQIFANEGAELVNMLHRLQKRAVQTDYKGGVPGSFIKSLYIAAVAVAKNSKGLTGGIPPENLSFTEKQKTVMTLMREGCSRNEIAERMGLKPNGVKSHVELIYRKLDVANSVDAVLKIKEMGIL
ncbi:MAG: LuxR C-terminal-related transcriptional regulator [Oscillospiraceae bacterium]|nr:LuxR C-terminal-related transcriptional regulator [Oscillospiraceae bacterium]